MPKVRFKRTVHTEAQLEKEQEPKANKNYSFTCKIDQNLMFNKPALSSCKLIFSMKIRPFNFLVNTNTSKHVEQLILLLTCLCIYCPGWWAQEFVFDDREAILNNPVVTGKRHWSEVFWRDYWGHPIHLSSSHKSYRPVTTLTFVLEHAAFGLRPFVHRITNIFLHAAVTLQIYTLVAKLLNLFKIKQKEAKNISAYLANSNDSPISKEFLIALVFAVHPIHSEAVCNIVGRAELLMSAFFLAAFDQFLSIKYSADKNPLQPTIIVYFTLTALSMFSKEQGIVILPICIVFDWLLPGNDVKRVTKHRSAILLCVLFFLLSLRMYINNFQSPIFSKEDNPAAFLPTVHIRALNYLYIWLLNLWLLVKPNQLSFDYSSGCIPIIKTVFEKRSFMCLLAVLISSLMFASCTYRLEWSKNKNRFYIFLISFGLLTFLPSSNLLVTVGFTLAERVLYLPSFPFIWLVLNLLEEFIKQIDPLLFYFQIDFSKNFQLNKSYAIRNAYNIALITILLLMSTKTFERCKEWNSEISLYSSGLTVCPNNPKIHYNIAKVLSNQGHTDEAQKNYLYTLKFNPNHELALNNLALILEKRGELEVAEALLRRALIIRPRFSTAWMNLGIVQMNKANYVESEKSFLRALDSKKDYSDCLFNLGSLYLKTNRSLEARECWLTVTNIEPAHAPAWSNLFLLLEHRNECETVNLLAEKALLWNPESASLYSQVGICMTKGTGSFERFDEKINKKAEFFLLKATEIEPKNYLYWNNLGVFYHRLEIIQLAQKAYKKSLELDPLNKVVRMNLLRLGNKDK